ncbi:MAG: outer membrane lipoprotein carrier protein LolA [Mariprofundaceae bacterium]|nr:outer membrane lipoprotein carrier protein LolA [Mariprofundaceae bacterium]
MKMKWICLVLYLMLGTNQLLCYAEGQQVSPSSDLAVALQDLATIQGFSCQFEQVLTYAEGGERVYSGDLAVLRPDKFRWQYHKPYVQLYVGDGKKIWLYEPDLMQVQYLQDLGEVEPVVMQLLNGHIRLQDVLVLGHEKRADGILYWQVQLKKGEQAVVIGLAVQDKKLRWIESQDVLGNRNRMTLLNVNKTLPSQDLFVLKVPEGVDVIGDME